MLFYPPDGTERYNCNYVSLMTCLPPSSSTCLRAPAKCTCQILLHTSDVVKSLRVVLLSLCLSDAVSGRRRCRSRLRSAEVAASTSPPPLGQSGTRELCCFASCLLSGLLCDALWEGHLAAPFPSRSGAVPACSVSGCPCLALSLWEFPLPL